MENYIPNNEEKEVDEKTERMIQVARDILTYSRNSLVVNLRFLDMALSQFQLHHCDHSTLLTDGRFLIFNPEHIIQLYKIAKEIPTRDYLHVVLHCVYRHMFMDPSIDRVYWDLACDIAVENTINELAADHKLKPIATVRAVKQAAYISSLKQEIKTLTAERIYAALRNIDTDHNRINEIRALFYADNHEIWYMSEDEKAANFNLPKKSGMDSKAELAKAWQEISERMQVDAETFGKKAGNLAGALTQNLASVNREKHDYSAFLKKFAVMGEAMKINDDEFDYVFYTYGLQLYENMPLIEPLEYKDIKAIKEFAIAIDTSGSTSGELVQNFVQKTYNILKSTESFFTKMNLHIIQCDAKIQEDVKITCQEDFDKYIENMKIHGLGGTDFRPVFEYVDKLRVDKEFSNLKGLIYFTDGYGNFPQKKPDYETAFVFINDETNNLDVPPWAIKLVLDKDEFKGDKK